MIYAKEARQITKENTNSTELHEIIEKILPAIEEAIRNASSYGLSNTIIKKDLLMDLANTYYFTRKQIMDALAVEIREFGYDATIPSSYTSIHIEW